MAGRRRRSHEVASKRGVDVGVELDRRVAGERVASGPRVLHERRERKSGGDVDPRFRPILGASGMEHLTTHALLDPQDLIVGAREVPGESPERLQRREEERARLAHPRGGSDVIAVAVREQLAILAREGDGCSFEGRLHSERGPSNPQLPADRAGSSSYVTSYTPWMVGWMVRSRVRASSSSCRVGATVPTGIRSASAHARPPATMRRARTGPIR